MNKPKNPVTIDNEDDSEDEEDHHQEEWMRLQIDTLFSTVNNEKGVDNIDY